MDDLVRLDSAFVDAGYDLIWEVDEREKLKYIYIPEYHVFAAKMSHTIKCTEILNALLNMDI